MILYTVQYSILVYYTSIAVLVYSVQYTSMYSYVYKYEFFLYTIYNYNK